MPTNSYFNHLENTAEQNLHQDLIIESIKTFGVDNYYLPRQYMNEDILYGEDTISQFSKSHLIEMYVKSVDGFEGEGDFVSRFGLEIRDQVIFSVARRRWENLNTGYDRPREGDIIFFPLNKKLYEVRFVEHESVFYQFGKLPIFDLTCELFQYSEEQLETGITDIDDIEREQGYAIDLVMSAGGSGDYVVDDKVYQGVSYAAATWDGTVVSWNATTRLLRVNDVKGALAAVATYGASSAGVNTGTAWTLSTTTDASGLADSDQELPTDPNADNLEFEIEADSILDFSESNPFGDVR